MKVVHIAAEMAPIAKVGGLADVLLGLSRAEIAKGIDVKIILPKYDCLDTSPIQHLTPLIKEFTTPWDGKKYENTVWQGWVQGVNVFFIEPEYPIDFFNRGIFYGAEDDQDRFLYFATAAFHFLKSYDQMPDVVHLHDWHTALITAFLQKEETKTILTIHNLSYQGQCSKNFLDKMGLDLKIEGDELNPLKEGIILSDVLTTVSPNYAKEITTKEYGCGLEDVIKQNLAKLKGILNGIDYTYWNPENDPLLPYPFSSKNLSERDKLKSFLKEKLSLSPEDKPIIGSVTRLVYQKGVDQIEWAIFETLKKGGQFILLGNSPVREENDRFLALEKRINDPENFAFINDFQEELAHQIYGGADFIIIPSLFEPCGLAQMISFRYGAIPIARKTGGLADAGFDLTEEGGNGFTFENKDEKALKTTVDRAINYWYSDKAEVIKLRQEGMIRDYSWNLPAQEYISLMRK